MQIGGLFNIWFCLIDVFVSKFKNVYTQGPGFSIVAVTDFAPTIYNAIFASKRKQNSPAISIQYHQFSNGATLFGVKNIVQIDSSADGVALRIISRLSIAKCIRCYFLVAKEVFYLNHPSHRLSHPASPYVRVFIIWGCARIPIQVMLKGYFGQAQSYNISRRKMNFVLFASLSFWWLSSFGTFKSRMIYFYNASAASRRMFVFGHQERFSEIILVDINI